MKKFTTEYLLQQYCRGQQTEDEYAEFQEWLAEDDQNKQRAEEMLRIYRISRAKEVYPSISHRKGLERALQQVRSQRKVRVRRLWMGAAASVAILIAVFSAATFVLNEEQALEPVIVSAKIEAGNSKATLVLGSGQEVVLDDAQNAVITTGNGGVIRNQDRLLSYEDQQADNDELNSIRTPRGGEYKLVLSDGTKVWLNAESELTYPVSFAGNTREISLKGEVYLEVAKDARKPFIVNTSKGKIQVLGTAFNVKDYAEDHLMTATLVEGKIKLSNEQESVELTPAMQAQITANNSAIALHKVDPSLYTAWKEGEFVFRNQSLREMMEVLSRWYDFDYQFETPTLENLMFSADISRYDDLEELLAVLAKTKDVAFELKEGILMIK